MRPARRPRRTTPKSGRRRNTFDVLIRYRGSFGPVGVAATAAYIGGGHVLDNQTGVPFNNNPLSRHHVRYNYEGLSVGDFGVAVTVGGFSVGGHYMHGRFNNQWAAWCRKGLADGDAWLVGASYTFGPVIVGAHWLRQRDAGDLGNAAFGRIRREQGVAVGGTYSLAPGVSIFLSGLWGERKQNGYNFVTGQGVTAATPSGNAVQQQGHRHRWSSVGTAFSW